MFWCAKSVKFHFRWGTKLGTIVTSIQDSKPRKKQISQSFSYCELITLLRNGTIVRCLWENKKTSEKSVFRETWSPELTSQLFPIPCYWSRGFVPHQKRNLMLLLHQNTGKENRYGKNFFAKLISTFGRFNRANKKICHIHFKACRLQYISAVYEECLTSFSDGVPTSSCSSSIRIRWSSAWPLVRKCHETAVGV